MRYATATAFRTALEQRLLAASQRNGTPLVRLRKLVTFDGREDNVLRSVPIIRLSGYTCSG